MNATMYATSKIKTLEFVNGELRLLDQTKLPVEEVYHACRTSNDVAQAIKEMRVRGAPAIGVSAAFGVVLGAQAWTGQSADELLRHLDAVAATLVATRPTAVNLSWAVTRMLNVARARFAAGMDAGRIVDILEAEAAAILDEDIALNERLGDHGSVLLQNGDTVLTHCNAGALATAGYGTALGVIRSAVRAGKRITVYADETRPYLQGARLTAWELHKDGIPVTLIADSMAGHFMQLGRINAVIVGADRIAANGDVANKIGTYTVAVLARAHNIPFYVAAPRSTIDLETPRGAEIPIEERSSREISHLGAIQLDPDGISIANPAFDVTAARYVSAIITEAGVVEAPYEEGLRGLF